MPKKEKKKETSNVLTLSTLFGHLSIYAGLRQFSGGEEEKRRRRRRRRRRGRGRRKRKRKTRGIGSGRSSMGIVGDFRRTIRIHEERK